MRRETFIWLFLIVSTFAVYCQVTTHDFVNFDDQQYVLENPQVQAGISQNSLPWAFTTSHASNWHPLTWLSHMLDWEFYGSASGGHHLTSVLLHLVNTLLLFIVLHRMTGALWRSAFVAALFALHPLHVESVAWVSERKDVLSTFFWMLAIWAYLLYAKHPSLLRYGAVALTFALGLLAKPMLVTLPFVLLLLDYWPLGRLNSAKQNSVRLVLEKLILFVFAGASSAMTILVQKSGGALRSIEVYSIKVRIANALVSYVTYIGKMIWPLNLAAFYPHPGPDLPIWRAAGAGLLLIAVSVLIMRTARQHPYLPVGWLWYLGTLVPVIGLVQVGTQAMADRYTYVPLIGLFIIIAWGAADLSSRWRIHQNTLAMVTCALLLALLVRSWQQIHHWRNSVDLWEHALKVTRNNWLAHDNLGLALAEKGKIDEAMEHYSEALRLKPTNVQTHNNLAVALAHQGRLDEAIAHYSAALQLKANTAEIHNNLAVTLVEAGEIERAIGHYVKALQIDPSYAEAHNNLGNALAAGGKLSQATAHYSEALRIKPAYPKAHNNLGVALARQGKLEEAIIHFEKALDLQPGFLQAKANLELALQDMGRPIEESREMN